MGPKSCGPGPGPGSLQLLGPMGIHGLPFLGPMDPWAHGSMGPWSMVPSTKYQVMCTRGYYVYHRVLYPLFFQGSPFCHHEGRHKRWEFLNRCNFRFRSTPSSFFPTQQIGFGAVGHCWTFFDVLCMCFLFFFWGTSQILEN